MAGGWTRDGAVQDQIDASIEDAVQQARSRLPEGKSLTHCEECDAEIPQARREIIPGVRLCVKCQELHDAEVYARMETDTSLIWTNGAVELDTITGVCLYLTLVVNPCHTESEDTVRLDHTFNDFRLLKLRMLIVNFLD